MSTRSQVKIISKEWNHKIYLYQHSDGYDLIKTVKKAISLGIRWDTPEYLTRIIFSHMIADDIYGETGYGIGNSEHGDIDYLIIVDIDKRLVINQEVNTIYDQTDYSKSKTTHKTIEVSTFADISKSLNQNTEKKTNL